MPWDKLWADGPLALPLQGKGAKDGSQLNVLRETSAAAAGGGGAASSAEILGDAGRALLAATIGGPGVNGGAAAAESESAPIPVNGSS